MFTKIKLWAFAHSSFSDWLDSQSGTTLGKCMTYAISGLFYGGLLAVAILSASVGAWDVAGTAVSTGYVIYKTNTVSPYAKCPRELEWIALAPCHVKDAYAAKLDSEKASQTTFS